MKITVLDAETLRFPEDAWSALAAEGELVLHDCTPADEAIIVERCAGADIVLTNKVPLSRAVLKQLSALQMVGALATGYNIIDTVAAKERGIVVCNVPAYSTGSVAQHTLALILELTNHVAAHNASVYKGDWVKSQHFSYWTSELVELSECVVGIVGFGEIGRQVGAVLQLLGATVIAHTRTPRNPPDWPGFEFVERDALFERSDIVTLHCPLTSENTGFVNAALLSRMKRNALLINTARGALVNEADLAQALNSGIIGGAGIDVVSIEPMRIDNPLLDARRCVITPHIAWAGPKARRSLLEITVQNVRSFKAGSPQNQVA